MMVSGLMRSVPLLLLAAVPANAREAGVLGDVLACRGITADAERLACFDRTSGRLAQAQGRGDVRVVDRAAAEKATAAQFGLTRAQVAEARPEAARERAPEPPPSPPELREISGTVASATQDALGRYVVVLADGARWRQREAGDMRRPRAGDAIRIRRAAMGSFMANIAGERAVRFERVQ